MNIDPTSVNSALPNNASNGNASNKNTLMPSNPAGTELLSHEKTGSNATPTGITLTTFEDEISKNRKIAYESMFQDEINDETKIKEIEPVIMIADSIFAAKGDISIVGGLPKAGKTSVSAYMMATALAEIARETDTLQIRSTFAHGKPVIYFDTEQPRSYTDKLRKTVISIIGADRQPKNLHIVNLRRYSSEEKWSRIQRWIGSYPDTHLWIIDGVADLIRDPNDTKESFGILQELMGFSDKLNTTIILYLHENPGNTGKLRGNLGSEAERKAGGVIAIKKHKDKGIHSIEAKLIRGSSDFEPVFFQWSKDLHRMVSVDASVADSMKSLDKASVKQKRLEEMAKTCLLTGSLSYSDLGASIVQHSRAIEGKQIQLRSAQNRIESMLEYGVIEKNDSFYFIASKYITQL